MNAYRITFTEFNFQATERDERIKTVVVAERQEAKNGIEAIKAALRAKVSPEHLADLDDPRNHYGSNKRLVLAGITFEARKIA